MYFWRYHSHRCRKLRSFTLRLTTVGFKHCCLRRWNSAKNRSFHQGKARRVISRAKMSDDSALSSPPKKHGLVESSPIEINQTKHQVMDEESDKSSPKHPSTSHWPRNDYNDSDSDGESQAKKRYSEDESDQSNTGDPINIRTRQLSKDDSTDLDPFDLRRRFISKHVSPLIPFTLLRERGADIRR
jgi:hypothetical protein